MRYVLRGLFALVLLVALALAAGFFYLRSSLPRLSGVLELPGLGAPVEVLRDANGVPHIYAAHQADAYFALGVVHAQDRLFQMEFQRRVGAGRLSEVLGEATLSNDRFLRTLSVYHYAAASVAHLDAETLTMLEAYVAGVNAFLETRRGALPPEFLLLGFTPEPWTVPDVLVWAKMMAWDLGGNWTADLLRARLLAVLTPEQVADLYPPVPGGPPVALPDLQGVYERLERSGLWAGLWDAAVHPLPPGAGSNNWVVSGARTASGAPLLANDPHLDLKAPSLWYLAHLSAPGLSVIGATLPGTPSVLLGRNERVAWGFTNTGPDVQDLFIEQLHPEDDGRYLTPDGDAAFVVREEVIRVKGREDVVLRVRESRHGPILSDVNAGAAAVAAGQGERYVLALAWTALTPDDLTVRAIRRVNEAQDWESFREALRDFAVPQQNIVYADVEGNIGFIAPARIPVRAAGDGRVPVPGWTGEYDWVGYVPFGELPQAFNPPSGQLVTANQRIVPDDYPHHLTHDWSEPYRAERITELLARSDAHTPASFAAIQGDDVSLMARDFLPFLREVAPTGTLPRRAMDLIQAWDADMDRDRPEPLIFAAWYRALVRLLVEDELGELFGSYYGFRPVFVLNALTGRTEHDWCDDARTPRQELCADLFARAFEEGVAELVARHGNRVENWAWGDAHAAYMDHDVMASTPLRGVFDLSVPSGGDAFTVNAARFAIGNDAAPYRQTSGPTYRAIYDLADLGASRFVHTTGQSGNPLSRHYRDLLERWRDVEYLPMTTDRASIRVAHALTLRPLATP
jgi:penicillin G amidase